MEPLRTRRTKVRQLLSAVALLTLLAHVLAEQIPLVDSDGRYIAYVDTLRDDTIYLWSGEPVAYLYASGRDELIYAFSGRHLGWYESGILRDLDGDAVGAREGVLRTQSRIPPIKGIQSLAPLRGVRAIPKLKPLFSNYYSRTSLETFLTAGTPTSSGTTSSGASGGTYAFTGMTWWVTRVESRGADVELSDGSRWEIQTIDRIHTTLWLPSDRVTVTLARSPLGNYRYSITHDRSGRAVLARYLGN